MYENAGEYRQAIAYYTESLNIANGIGSKRGVAYSLGSLARMSSLLGETAKAYRLLHTGIATLKGR